MTAPRARLHDHHIHLLALAAARQSVRIGPADITGLDGLARVLRAADRDLPAGRWIRAIGYHASVAGELDRDRLDQLVADRAVRVQDRSGARWTFNSAAIDALRLDAIARDGIERDEHGRVTGRVHRADSWLRSVLPASAAPDLAPVGKELAAYGVTAVTDTTPYTRLGDLAVLSDAVRSGALPQRVLVTGGPELAAHAAPPGLTWGPVKIIIDDASYPALDELTDQIVAAHRHERNAAIHCVTRTALALAIAAWDVVGARPGDRVEHAAVVPDELRAAIKRHDLTVVTQPGFIAERGDEYLREVDADDLPYLYPCRTLMDAGIRVLGSTDAPYTDPDPWRAIRAATTRTTRSGAVVGPQEVISADAAVALFAGG
jgi:predicted amidohydrolase YtcJ